MLIQSLKLTELMTKEICMAQIFSSALTPKTTEKRRTKPPKISTRKEIIKIRAEIIEKEMKETIVKINKTKSWLFEKIKSTKLSVQFSSVQTLRKKNLKKIKKKF